MSDPLRMPPPDSSRLRLRGLERRKQIAATAAALFLEKGYERVTLDEVARRAGGSKSAIYEHFKNKEGVLLAAIEFLLPSPYQFPNQVSGETLTFDAHIAVLVKSLLDYYTQPKNLKFIRLALVESTRFPGIAKAWVELTRSHSRYLTELLAATEHGSLLSLDQIARIALAVHALIVSEPLHQALAGQKLTKNEQETVEQDAILIAKAIAKDIRITDHSSGSTSTAGRG